MKWEHRAIDADNLVVAIAELEDEDPGGWQDWELVTVLPVVGGWLYYFKRALPEIRVETMVDLRDLDRATIDVDPDLLADLVRERES